MNPWTAEELLQLAPRAREDYVKALVEGWSDIQRTGIDTPLRLCEFVAQIAHETGGFTIVIENLSYSAKRLCQVWPSRFSSAIDPRALACANNPERLAETVYGGRLGNRDRGDGYLYRGRGFLQDTGRACYREYGRLIGIDLESHPDLLENPTISLKVALARWQHMELNRFADRHYTRAIGNAINRGDPYSSHEPIGAAERAAWFARAWQLFGDSDKPAVGPELALGAHGPRVEAVQNRLRDLGYGVGQVDRVLGPTTARAIAAFKLDYKRTTGAELEPDELIGAHAEHALEQGRPIEVAAARANATEADLAQAGSSEVTGGQQQKAAGTALALAGAAKGAQELGAMDALQSSLGWVPTAHGLLAPTLDAIRWGLQHAFWVIAIIGGVWIWTKGRQVILARLRAHRLGFNLWR